jgi:Amt family ammonium transporter
VHGIGGIIGALLTGVFVAESLGGAGLAEGMTMAGQLWVQAYAIVATVAYDAILTFVILKAIDALIGLRVDEEQESEGLDLALHGERGYTL